MKLLLFLTLFLSGCCTPCPRCDYLCTYLPHPEGIVEVCSDGKTTLLQCGQDWRNCTEAPTARTEEMNEELNNYMEWEKVRLVHD